MGVNRKIVSLIAVIGALACLISFFLSSGKGDVISAVIFGLAGLYCLSNAVGALKRKKENEVGK